MKSEVALTLSLALLTVYSLLSVLELQSTLVVMAITYSVPDHPSNPTT